MLPIFWGKSYASLILKPSRKMGAFLCSSANRKNINGWVASTGLLASVAYISLTTSNSGVAAAEGPSPVHLTSVQAVKGHRPYMEDEHVVSKDNRFCAVYDGHGGAAVSKYLRQNLYAQFQVLLPAPLEDCDIQHVKDCLARSVSRVDEEIQKVSHWAYQGSTCTICICHPQGLLTANVGDSRAVLSRRGHAIDLTKDHKPDDPAELKRIKKMGGTVKWYGFLDPEGNPVEGTGVYRVNGGLAVARSLGDSHERPFVSGEADLRLFSRDEEGDQFVILASDGVWDVLSSSEAVEFVHAILEGQVGALRSGRHFSAAQRQAEIKVSDWTQRYGNDRGLIRAAMLSRKRKMARYLTEEALRRGSADNITVIVMWLQ